MLRKIFAPLFLLLLSVSAQAAPSALEARLFKEVRPMEERPSFYIQCQLRYAMDCAALRSTFFSMFGMIDQVDSDKAMVKVLLTDETASQGVLVHSTWSSSDDVSMVDFKLPNLLIPQEYDATKTQAEIVNLLVQGLIPHFRVKSGTGLADVLTASLKNSGHTGDEKSGPLYVDLSLNGSISKSGIGAKNADGSEGPAYSNTNGFGSVTVNHSTERTRVVVGGEAYYSKVSQPGADGAKISADNLSQYVWVMGVYSLNKTKRWNVAIFGSQGSDPGSNFKSGTEVGGGLEYNLVPFRIEQPYEFRIRSTVSQMSDRLVMMNDRGNTEESYQVLSAQLFAYWLLWKEKVGLTGSARAATNLSHSGYYSGRASLELSFRITDNIRVTTSGNYGYLKKSIRFPGTPDFSNPLKTSFQTSGYAGGNFSTSIGVGITLGKGKTRYNRDRRFK